MKRCTFLAFYCLLVFSCNKQKEKISAKRSSNIRIEKVSFNLPSSDGVSNSISNYSVFNNRLYLFDNYNFRLVEINIESNEVISYKFANETSDPIQFVNKFKVISSDSLILFDGRRLLISDFKGSISRQFNVFDGIEDLWRSGVYNEYPIENISNELVYRKRNNSVIFYFANSSEISKKSIFGELSLSDGKWSPIKASHPGYYDGISLDYTTFPHVLVNNDTLAFLYTISPIVSIVDMRIGKQADYTIESFSGKQFAEPQTDRAFWSEDYFGTWILNNPSFQKLLYDDKRKLFYRFSSPSLNLNTFENAELEYLTNNKVFLTILDQDLDVVANFELESGIYDPRSAFLVKNGIWIGYSELRIPDEQFIYGDFIRIIE